MSSTGYYKIRFDKQERIAVVAEEMGDEGYWGDPVLNRNNSWTNWQLNLTPIFDVEFVSESELLACGQEILVYREKNRRTSRGIILRSLDGGKSWNVIHRSKENEAFIELAQVQPRQFYVVSDTGHFLRFSLN